MRGPGGAFALVGFELVVGTFVLMWVTLLVWRVVDRGHYRAATWVLVPLQIAFSFALPGRLRGMGFVLAALSSLFLVSIYSQRPLLEWVSGGLASAWGIGLLVSAGASSCGGCAAGSVHALAGAFVLGGVTHGMTLGHWYLNQPRLPIEPLKGATWIFLASIAISLAAGIVTRPRLMSASVQGALLFSSSGFWWTWLLLLAGTAVLGGMIRSTVWSRSTQSATGLLYIAMVTVLGGQFLLNLLLAS